MKKLITLILIHYSHYLIKHMQGSDIIKLMDYDLETITKLVTNYFIDNPDIMSETDKLLQ